MRYGPNERDMLALHHEIEFEDASGQPYRYVSHLTEFGDPGGDSAMSKTVGIPAALALGRILDGTIHIPGVRIPVSPDVYGPVLADLGQLGIREVEVAEPLD